MPPPPLDPPMHKNSKTVNEQIKSVGNLPSYDQTFNSQNVSPTLYNIGFLSNKDSTFWQAKMTFP